MNDLGNQGWQLVQTTPEVAGRNMDVLGFRDENSSQRWTAVYRCIF